MPWIVVEDAIFVCTVSSTVRSTPEQQKSFLFKQEM